MYKVCNFTREIINSRRENIWVITCFLGGASGFFGGQWIFWFTGPPGQWLPQSNVKACQYNFYYYHYQPGSNIIIVYCKHITHACACTRAHKHERAHKHTHTHTPVAVQVVAGSVAPNHDGVRPFSLFPLAINGRSLLQSNKHLSWRPGFSDFWVFFGYKKLLGQTETRTRNRMYCQSILGLERIHQVTNTIRIANALFLRG